MRNGDRRTLKSLVSKEELRRFWKEEIKMPVRKIRKHKPFEPRGRLHDFVRIHLSSLGFTVYPTEIGCDSLGVPLVQYHPWLDVAAYKDGCYYGFEYKSAAEGIHAKVFDQITKPYSSRQHVLHNTPFF